jgi:hypothetical protein
MRAGFTMFLTEDRARAQSYFEILCQRYDQQVAHLGTIIKGGCSDVDLSMILSLVALVVSGLGTVFSILYSRRQLEIMKKGAKVVEQDNAQKLRLSETLEAVQNLIESIDKHANVRWFSFSDLGSLSDSIVRHLHDKHARKIEIILRPSYVQWSILNEGMMSEVKLAPSDSFEEFISLFKRDFQGVVFHFRITPEITENQSVELGDPLISIKELYEALESARRFSDIIEKVDRDVLIELEEAFMQTLRTLYEGLMKEDQIIVSASIQSNEISNFLLDKIVGYEALKRNLEEIRGPLCNRLDNVQKELFHRV